MKMKKLLSVFLVASMMTSAVNIVTVSAAETGIVAAHIVEKKAMTEDEYNAAYLKEYFGIEFGYSVNWGAFNEALKKIVGTEVKGVKKDDAIPYTQAVKATVIASNMEELAKTFKPDKVKAILDRNKIGAIRKSDSQYIACALSTGIVETQFEKGAVILNNATTVAQANDLLMYVATANGKTANFLGYSNDADIFGKLNNSWESFAIFNNEKLDEIGSKAVKAQVTTGFNLKKASYDANFLPKLTLRYGHDNIKHANQLLGLLNSEGIVAKVQLEPKVSIFEYLLEWGPVPEPIPTYVVKKVNDDLYLTYAVEYDLALEFQSISDKEAFDAIVLENAKKNDSNPADKPLLFSSWWQPLYTSPVKMEEGYNLIYDNVITEGEYSIHPFCLPENKEKVAKEFKKLDSSIEVVQKPLWCDDAFFRYLHGDFQ